MKNMLLDLLVRLTALLRIRKIADAVSRRENDRRCRRSSAASDDAMFGPTAFIHNRQNEPRAIAIGKKTLIDGELMIFNDAGKIEIGESSFVGKGSRVWSGESVKIGSHVFVAHNVTISDTNAHPFSAAERASEYQARMIEGKPYARGSTLTSPVVIGNHVWINFGVSILKGVRIGEGAVIGAGSLVTKDVPAWTFAAGVPAKALRPITER
jgi:acetyltransferase-like isoleucine patch superfamily enzyme